jgi:hypothetical protein
LWDSQKRQNADLQNGYSSGGQEKMKVVQFDFNKYLKMYCQVVLAVEGLSVTMASRPLVPVEKELERLRNRNAIEACRRKGEKGFCHFLQKMKGSAKVILRFSIL